MVSASIAALQTRYPHPVASGTTHRLRAIGRGRVGGRDDESVLVAPTCALTVDVEDWYQSSVDYNAPISDRVVGNMARLMELLDGSQVKATFFVQGRVAETFPRLVQEIHDQGHEVQSHGYSHRPLYAMDRHALRDELRAARATVEDACGVRLTAFRAPDFSILRDNLWALEVLSEEGFEVDSSIFPMAMKRYGIGGSDLGPQRMTLPNGAEILEVPVAIWNVAGVKLPVAGGGYFRLLPQFVIERAMRSIIASGRPAIVYCHPYEFNPTEMNDYRGMVSPLFQLHQGLGRGSFIRRVRHLLQTLPFGRFDEVLAGWEHRERGGANPKEERP